MPRYPVHNYGMDKMAQWIMPAMHDKAELERTIKSKAATRAWGLAGDSAKSGVLDENTSAMAESVLPGSSGTMQKISDQAERKQKSEEVRNQIAIKGQATKTVDGLLKLARKQAKLPGGAGEEQAKQLYDQINKINESAFGSTYPKLSINDDPAIINSKLMVATSNELGKGIESLETDPSNTKLFGDMWNALNDAEVKFGTDGKALVAPHRDRMKQIQTKQKESLSLSGQKGKVFSGMTPSEQKQTVMKPTVEVKVGSAVEKQKALGKVKQEQYYKSPKFRTDVQKTVIQAKQKMWVRMTKGQKSDELRVEADKQVKQHYGEDLQFGQLGGKKGWYRGKTLIIPWTD